MGDNTMGNQQERLSNDLCWLAGVWESEGWFTMLHQNKRTGRQYGLNCGIINSDFDFILEVRKILDKHNLAYYLTKPRVHGIGEKPKVMIVIQGFKRVKRFLNIVTPYIRTKVRKVQILREFIIYRENKKNQKAPYGHIENNLYMELQKLNNRKSDNILREHTPNITKSNDDVFRTAGKPAELQSLN